MPKNRFPDSSEKRELRRQDRRHLADYRVRRAASAGLSYCGLPSIEFLDVQEWQTELGSVTAVEQDETVLDDMRIHWDYINLGIPIHFIGPSSVQQYLLSTSDCHDLYNLDFYGGFFYTRGNQTPQSIQLLRALCSRHAQATRSFVLICSFNARDTGAREYVDLISQIPVALSGWQNVKECCKAHEKNQATRLKLCFPFCCWQIGKTNGFKVRSLTPYVYHSSATMVHFYVEFLYQPTGLPELTSQKELAELVSEKLYRLDGVRPVIELNPPAVDREK
ncbi:MAG: hypothetical protein ACR2IE_13085 [Candidatus Sumerlaeaceae bacterium]